MKFQVIENGGVTDPQGFKACGITVGLKKSGSADMALIFSEKPASFAGAFTSCLFAAAPVQVCRDRIKSSKKVSAVIINSGNANACTGAEGYKNAQVMCEETAALLSIDPSAVLVSSTGRIGVQLPMDKISAGIKKACSSLSAAGGDQASKAIMTTDTRQKNIAVKVNINGKAVTIGGMTKGAGMIAPKLDVLHATMLCYITTDADVDNAFLAELLEQGTGKSFNRVTVDGDTSTNDTVLVIANGTSGVKIEKNSQAASVFAEALFYVMIDLAKKIACDGEGMTKMVTVEVLNAPTENDARLCAGAIANSLLCKTAWFGCDPNWGRVLCAAGYSGAKFDPDRVSLDYDDMPVVRNGQDAGTPEAALAQLMKKPEFTVRINLNSGSSGWTIWTNDISYEYVKINADYHT